MDRHIKESDWKRLKRIRGTALERYCQSVLEEMKTIASQEDQSSHQRYLKIYDLMMHRDKELGEMFDHPRRSAAILQLALMRFHHLVNDKEFSEFGPETRALVQAHMKMWQS